MRKALVYIALVVIFTKSIRFAVNFGTRGVQKRPAEVAYSTFIQATKNGHVEKAVFEQQSSQIMFQIKKLNDIANIDDQLFTKTIFYKQAQQIEYLNKALDVAEQNVKESKLNAQQMQDQGIAKAVPVYLNGIQNKIKLAKVSRQLGGDPQKNLEKLRAVTQRFLDQPQWFCTHKIVDNQQVVPILLDNNVLVQMNDKSFSTALSRTIANLMIVWLPLIPFFFFFRNTMQGRSGVGSRKKPPQQKNSVQATSFKDVAGVGSAIYELEEVVEILRHPQKFLKMNAKLPGGVLLCGPPGTGKTLLARAVAGEAGVNFFAASASEFVELYVGRGAARVRQLFLEARQSKPAVVFIDELDAIGGRRGMGLNEEREQTLNQLLTELDGYDGRDGVLMLAATNRPNILDPALLRPGRISRKIFIPIPDQQGRGQILQVHMRKLGTQSEQEKIQICQQIAAVTPGFSGAELANVVNEATLLAIRKNKSAVDVEDLLEGVIRTRNGINNNVIQIPIIQKIKEWFQNTFQQSQQQKGGYPMGRI